MNQAFSIGKLKTGLRLQNMLRIFAIMFFLIPALVTVARGLTRSNASTVDGFVTKVDAPTTFDVGTLHVVLDGQASCETRTSYALKTRAYPFGKIQESFVKQQRDQHVRKTLTSCVNLPLVIGSRIHLAGTAKNDNHVFKATNAAINIETPNKTLKGAALVEEAAGITGSHDKNGNLWINGYPVGVAPTTKIYAAPASTTIRYIMHFDGTIGMSATRQFPIPYTSSTLSTNTWATYHAWRAVDGGITANQLRFWPNGIYADEQEFLKKSVAVIHAPDYGRHISGSIGFIHEKAIKILPDQVVQNWVTKLGREMIPEYQKNLSDDDPAKIKFTFYVIHPFIVTVGNDFVSIDGALPSVGEFKYTYNSPKSGNAVNSIIAMPNGLILIPDCVPSYLNNSAQFSALLSYAITSVLQKQAYLAWPIITSPYARHLYLLRESAYPFIPFGYWQTTQQLRIGIRQMYLAGYDIREAPYAWAVAQGTPVNNPVMNSKHPDQETPWYAAYAFDYISQYYKDVDYSKLKRGDAEYAEFLGELRKADPAAFAAKK